MVTTHVQWHHAERAEDCCTAVVQAVRTIITEAVQARGHAVVAFPGGKTPLPILAALAALPLPWPQVTVIPGDDRVVPISSPLSNASVLTQHFSPRGARVLALSAEVDDYVRAGRDADAMLQQLAWPPDLVWLGMGGDGHTASIFAGPDLDAALAPAPDVRAIGVRPDPLPPEAPVPRVTLTAAAIAEARHVIVVIAGADKQRLLAQAIAEGEASTFPIGRVLARVHGAVVFACPA